MRDHKIISILPLGESALLVNFEQRIDEEIHQKVINLHHSLSNMKGISFLIPAYSSLTVGFDIIETSFEKLIHEIEKKSHSSINSLHKSRQLKIPVCYEREFALDLEDLSHSIQMSEEEIIIVHSSQNYLVYMLGFLPGFPFMGTLPDQLRCKRKTKPRISIPPGSVGLAGEQTGIYPCQSPGGWQIIGKTPLPIFSTTKDSPFLFHVGDQVKFEAISKKEYQHISDELTHETFNWEGIYG